MRVKFLRANIILLVLVLIYFYASDAVSQDKARINIGFIYNINSLYPWGQVTLEPQYVMQNIYETLIRIKKGSLDIEPCLATKIDATPDYKVWTAYLRKNVKFHDGSPLNADTVIESISLHGFFQGKAIKIDDLTVKFILDKPNVTFPTTLTTSYYSIASMATINCYKSNCKSPVFAGTGPYKLESWKPPKEIILTVNKEYWGKIPAGKNVAFISFNTEAELLQALKNEKVHLVPTILPSSIAVIRELPYLEFRSTQNLGLGFLCMNTTRKPFTNPLVRLAVSYAINKKDLVKKYFFGGNTGVVAKTFAPIQILKLSDESMEKEYNPEQAKAMLKQAGYADGFETTLTALDIPRPYMPDPPQIAQDIKKNLEAVGIKVKIKILAQDSNSENPIPKGNYDMLLNGWMADTPDPNDYLTSLLVSDSINLTNLTRWSNKKFDELIETARSQANPAERLKTYYQAQAIFHQQMPFVPLFYSLQTAVWNKKLIGFVPHPLNKLYLQYLSFQ